MGNALLLETHEVLEKFAQKVETLQKQVEAEAAARIVAERRAEAEAEARRVGEEARKVAEARVAELEAELAKLRRR